MQIDVNSKPLADEIRTKMDCYRAELLKFGMCEPSRLKSSVWHWRFFKPVTELTAFVVNLKGCDTHIAVTYGYASTAFTRMASCESDLTQLGIDDESITLREKAIIFSEMDDANVRAQIARMYEEYQQTSKDDLLLAAKARRKAFIQQITVNLKPMGFRKKANTWTRFLEGECVLMFNLQKSSFSDQYYFNIYIDKSEKDHCGNCYYSRILPDDASLIDWQTMSASKLESFMHSSVIPALESIIHTPLCQLGQPPDIWSGCNCDRQKCPQCWVEKNLWEANQTDSEE